MLAEDLNGFFVFAIIVTIAVLVAIAAKRSGHRPGFIQQKNHLDRRAFKKCPKCADQLPLSALVCDACEYNFLSGFVGHRHKLLPAPDAGQLST